VYRVVFNTIGILFTVKQAIKHVEDKCKQNPNNVITTSHTEKKQTKKHHNMHAELLS